MTWSLTVRALMRQRGITQQELADRLGVTQGAVAHWLNGRRRPTLEVLKEIAQALGVTPASLMNGEAAAPSGDPERLPIPLLALDQVAPLINNQSASPTAVSAIASLVPDITLSQHAFAVRIKDNAMVPEFCIGDVIVIDPALALTPGDFVLAVSDGQEPLFRKYRPLGIDRHHDKLIELLPLNEDYPPLRSDNLPFRIIGPMVEHRRYRPR